MRHEEFEPVLTRSISHQQVLALVDA